MCLVTSALCEPMDCSLPGSSVHGILWARILEWAAISSFRDLTYPGLKPRSPVLEENSLPTEPSDKPLGKTIDKNNPDYQGKK